MVAPVEEEEIDAPVAVTEEDTGNIRQPVLRVRPVIAEGRERALANRVGAIGIVEAEIVIVPGRELRHRVQQWLERLHRALLAVLLLEHGSKGVSP